MTGLGAWTAWLVLASTSTPVDGAAASVLLVDLEGDGLYLTDAAYPVAFDLDADGRREWTAWTAAGRAEAFLWIDLDGDETVDGAAELFASEPLPVDSATARSRNHAHSRLAALDRLAAGGDGDGLLSPLDASWSALRLWIDGDHDGRSAPHEVTTLLEGGVRGIDLEFQRVLLLDGSANWIRARAAFHRAGDGRGGEVLEVEFATPGGGRR